VNFELMVYPGGKPPATIPANSPPAFLVCANDDEYGCDQVTLDLLQAFRTAKVSVEAHFFAQGKHAFNMGDRSTFAAVKGWPQRMADWLGDRGLLKPAQ
jgi:dienelactone hydrolase